MAISKIVPFIGSVVKVNNVAKAWNSIYVKTFEEVESFEPSQANNFSSNKTYYGWVSGENLPMCEDGLFCSCKCRIKV